MSSSLTLQFELANESAYESYPVRTITLKHPHANSVKIGRGSKSGDAALYPGPENALFDSRVMSREHALVTVDFANKQICIEDVGSMHGTKINNKSIVPHHPERLLDRDILEIRGGSLRGAEHFPPLDVAVSFRWSDRRLEASVGSTSRPRNTFSVPEFSDDDFEEDEGGLQLFAEVVDRDPQTRTVTSSATKQVFSIPDSDDSDVDSIASSYPSDEDAQDEVNTSPSSPAGLTDAEKKADLATVVAANPLGAPFYETGISNQLIESKATFLSSDYVTESEADDEDYDYYDEMGQAPSETGHERQDLRAPSPSDAAMPKPSALSTTPYDAFSNTTSHSAIPSTCNFTETRSSFSQRLPGVSSFRLPDPEGNTFASYGYPPALPAARTTFAPLSTYFAPAEYAHSSNKPLWSTYRTDDSARPKEPKENTNPHTAGFHNHVAQEAKPTKRKADFISSEDESLAQETAGSDLQEITAYTFYHPPEGSDEPVTTDAGPTEHTSAIDKPETTVTPPSFVFKGENTTAEPSQKRIRLTKPRARRGGSVSRYVATAVAGMAIGAIGALWGLVSLPEDFFA